MIMSILAKVCTICGQKIGKNEVYLGCTNCDTYYHVTCFKHMCSRRSTEKHIA